MIHLKENRVELVRAIETRDGIQSEKRRREFCSSRQVFSRQRTYNYVRINFPARTIIKIHNRKRQNSIYKRTDITVKYKLESATKRSSPARSNKDRKASNTSYGIFKSKPNTQKGQYKIVTNSDANTNPRKYNMKEIEEKGTGGEIAQERSHAIKKEKLEAYSAEFNTESQTYKDEVTVTKHKEGSILKNTQSMGRAPNAAAIGPSPEEKVAASKTGNSDGFTLVGTGGKVKWEFLLTAMTTDKEIEQTATAKLLQAVEKWRDNLTSRSSMELPP